MLWFCVLVAAFAINARADACVSAGGLDLASYFNRTEQAVLAGVGHLLDMTLCGKINKACGSGECPRPYCCAACESWPVDGAREGACLGKNYTGFEDDEQGNVVLVYTGGDPVDSPGFPKGPRKLKIHLVCDSTTEFEIQSYDVPSGTDPSGTYIYHIHIQTSAACKADPCSGTSCDTCVKRGKSCLWCIDSNSCLSTPGTCQTWIEEPEYCPAHSCEQDNCVDCTEVGCDWCLEGGCQAQSNLCKKGAITNPNQCSIRK